MPLTTMDYKYAGHNNLVLGDIIVWKLAGLTSLLRVSRRTVHTVWICPLTTSDSKDIDTWVQIEKNRYYGARFHCYVNNSYMDGEEERLEKRGDTYQLIRNTGARYMYTYNEEAFLEEHIPGPFLEHHSHDTRLHYERFISVPWVPVPPRFHRAEAVVIVEEPVQNEIVEPVDELDRIFREMAVQYHAQQAVNIFVPEQPPNA